MKRRGLRWLFLYVFLLALGVWTLAHAANNQTETPLIPITKDPAINRDFQQAMNAIQYPNISTGTAQNFTIVNGSVTSRSIIGTGTNDSAIPGRVGEYISSTTAPSGGPSQGNNFPATGHWGDLLSISLTAGDWDVSFVTVPDRNTASLAQFTDAEIGLSFSPGDTASGLIIGDNRILFGTSSGISDTSLTLSSYRVSLTTTNTVYGKFLATYTAGQPVCYGRLSARRVR